MYGYCWDELDILLPFNVQHVNVLQGKYISKFHAMGSYVIFYYLGNR